MGRVQTLHGSYTIIVKQRIIMENNSDNVVNGNLCQECRSFGGTTKDSLNNKNCKDTGCPVYKWKENNVRQSKHRQRCGT